ncbi:hypothetical protein HH1059_11770 [Halorhodospira halochloris]|uniref:Uncharacterized protein n=1 Tax=Halorhodospira halochloris TaxID=1052 RepID=A0A0X8X988_HALHR|nr:hypothetical protein [Halorhodospira halochloris]BAU57870.1 hypothetical protein HH1059_11770 [Halorhodospira halochloris]
MTRKELRTISLIGASALVVGCAAFDERDLQRWAMDRATDEVIDRATSPADGEADEEERQDRQDRGLEEGDRTVEAGQCTEEQIAKMIQRDISREVIGHVCASDTDAVATSEEDDSEDEEKDVELEDERLAEVSDEEDVEEGVSAEPETTSAETEEEPYDADREPRRTFIGGGYYQLAQRVQVRTTQTDREQFDGPSIVLRQAFHDYWTGEIRYYSINHDDHSEWDVSGLVINLWLSTNAFEPGWNFGVGGGFYTEDWEQESFAGFNIGLLIGYRWENFGFDLVAGGRDTSDQDDTLYGDSEVSHSTGSLNFLYQF